jgi:phosphoribosylaminoimidazolecarboxamide formyltransferase/IMP cyclohydrolase
MQVPDLSGYVPAGCDLKKVVGGLVQDGTWHGQGFRLPSGHREKTDPGRIRGVDFAWRICKHEIQPLFSRKGSDGRNRCRQMSRVDSSRIAVQKAQLPIKGTVLASDAFFPFRDGVDAAAEAGVTAIIQPGGSVRDEEVIQAANEHGMAMLFTGMRHFRH